MTLTLSVFQSSNAQETKISSGKLVRVENFASQFVKPRNVDIWLPDKYSFRRKYAVIYMHDGQMLFDSTTTWNKQEWQVDEVIGKLLNQGKISNCIVIGVWNTDLRHSEYFPQKPFKSLPASFQDSLLARGARKETPGLFPSGVQSDNYLKFLVRELKPYIDKTYSTKPEPENTFVAGSSMGGLISMYAICEYPNVFGGAACLSTHWPGILNEENNPVPNTFVKYLQAKLPAPDSHKFYFDFGTEALDSLYEPLQQKVDGVMKKRGYSPENWMTVKFEGEGHNEKAWANRLEVPVNFLLGR
jgi:enterochelin esterase-like enzyme